MKLRLHRKRTDSASVVSFELPDDARAWYTKLITKGAKNGDWYDVTIEEPKRGRTTGAHSQSHHGNGHCMQISAETGNSFEAVKMHTKYMAMEQGGWQWDTIAGKEYPKSEAGATIEEAIVWIEATHQLAAELGIKLVEE
jgi:hypothetical protein